MDETNNKQMQQWYIWVLVLLALEIIAAYFLTQSFL